MTRPFVRWPNPCLAAPAASVTEITDDIRAIWDEMVEAMRAMPGVGLAAPQLGVMLRLAVVDAADGRFPTLRMANPEVIETGPDTDIGPEASPNIPGIEVRLRRPTRVRVRYLDASGTAAEADLPGLWARSMLHQIDHLEGRTIIDRLSPVRRDMVLRKLRKRAG